jgi:hypothetical protein
LGDWADCQELVDRLDWLIDLGAGTRAARRQSTNQPINQSINQSINLIKKSPNHPNHPIQSPIEHQQITNPWILISPP